MKLIFGYTEAAATATLNRLHLGEAGYESLAESAGLRTRC